MSESKPDVRHLLDKLLCHVNGVTAWHRHGGKIPKDKLDALSNVQIEIEEALREPVVSKSDFEPQKESYPGPHGYTMVRTELWDQMREKLSSSAPPKLEVKDIDRMVDRFLGWELPEDFSPDGGISYTPLYLTTGQRMKLVGTDLFTASQARRMVEYIVSAPESRPVEKPGAKKYLVALEIGGVQEHPGVQYIDAEVIEAPTPQEAENQYNIKHKCSYYYAHCVGEVDVRGQITVPTSMLVRCKRA